MKQWYYTKVGLQQGPVPENELLQKIRRGEIDGNNLVWCEGMAEWKPLSRVAELSGEAISPASTAVDASETLLVKPTPVLPSQQLGGSVPLPQPPAYHGNYVAPVIPTYMWQSVTATVVGLIFCCFLGMPFGIVAIVYASKVEGLRVQGDLFGATIASNNAKTWMILAFVCSALGFAMNVFYLLAALFSSR